MLLDSSNVSLLPYACPCSHCYAKKRVKLNRCFAFEKHLHILWWTPFTTASMPQSGVQRSALIVTLIFFLRRFTTPTVSLRTLHLVQKKESEAVRWWYTPGHLTPLLLAEGYWAPTPHHVLWRWGVLECISPLGFFICGAGGSMVVWRYGVYTCNNMWYAFTKWSHRV